MEEMIVKVLSLMVIQTAFLKDSLVHCGALRRVLADKGLLDSTKYTEFSETASNMDACQLLDEHLKEIQALIQTISNKGRVQ